MNNNARTKNDSLQAVFVNFYSRLDFKNLNKLPNLHAPNNYTTL